MSVSPQTKAAWEGALKEDYLPVIREQFSRERVLDTILENNSEDIEGLEAVISIRMSPNVGVGYRGENVALPSPGGQVIKKVKVPMRYIYGGVAFSGPLIAATRSNVGSYARVIQDEMENLVKDLRKITNFYNYGDGSGAIAQIISTPTNDTMVVDRWSPLFEDPYVLDSYTAKTGGAQGMNSKAIEESDEDTLTLTITGHGASANDYIFLEDTRGVVQMGLMGIIDDGTFVTTHQSLARTDYPRWKAHVLGASANRTISEKICMDALAVARSKTISPDIFVGTPFQLNDLAQELQQQRQFVNPTRKLEGGIRAVDIGGIPFTEDPDCPPGYAFLFERKNISFFSSGPLDWMDKDGSVLQRSLDRKDAYEATLFMYREMGSYRNNTAIRLEDIAENKPS